LGKEGFGDGDPPEFLKNEPGIPRTTVSFKKGLNFDLKNVGISC
jgi:hypothetical protein